MKRLRYLFCCLALLAPAPDVPVADAQAKHRRAAQTRQRQRDRARPRTPVNPELLAARKIHAAAFADPYDDEKFKAYRDSLPKDDEYYVAEGDLLLTEDELRIHLASRRRRARRGRRHSSELALSTRGGADNVYRTEEERRLTYAVDRKSFPTEAQYIIVRDNMKVAARRWEAVCRECKIVFLHRAEFDDDSPEPSESVNFVVRYHDSGGKYIAAAFYPHYAASRRYLKIDPSYFTSPYNKAGVLKHELGHVLGYRHEHIRRIAGCYQYREANDEWRPLSRYDPRSVMHYMCSGGGTYKLDLSKLDVSSHRRIYNGEYKLKQVRQVPRLRPR